MISQSPVAGVQPSLKYAWYTLGLLTLANISSFLDRQILALLVAPIKRDMHLTDTQVSLLIGLSFALFYTIFGMLMRRLFEGANCRNIVPAVLLFGVSIPLYVPV
jgi:hypothetical protein